MEVTLKNFSVERALLLQNIRDSDFISIDFEFSGLGVSKVLPYDDPDLVYTVLSQTLSDYAIVQVGLCTVRYVAEKGGYEIAVYNIYVYPRTPKVVTDREEASISVQLTSFEFLAAHAFDFNKWAKEGVGYVRAADEERFKVEVEKRHAWKLKNAVSNGEKKHKEVVEIPDEQKPYVNKYLQQVKTVFETGDGGQQTVLAPPRELRRYVHDALLSVYGPKVYVEMRRSEDGEDRALFVAKCKSEVEFKARFDLLLEKDLAQLTDAVGVGEIFRLIAQTGKLVVGHNMFLDILHAVKSFWRQLPQTYEEFKHDLEQCFPALLDTKVLATQFRLKELFKDGASLGKVFKRVQSPPFVDVKVDAVDERYSYADGVSRAHEAGYDAYMTAVICIKLVQGLETRSTSPQTAGPIRATTGALEAYLNKCCCGWVIDVPYFTFRGAELAPDRSNVFHVQLQTDSWSNNNFVSLFSVYGFIKIKWIDSRSAFIQVCRENVNGAGLANKLSSSECCVRTADEFLSERRRRLSSIEANGASVQSRLKFKRSSGDSPAATASPVPTLKRPKVDASQVIDAAPKATSSCDVFEESSDWS